MVYDSMVLIILWDAHLGSNSGMCNIERIAACAGAIKEDNLRLMKEDDKINESSNVSDQVW